MRSLGFALLLAMVPLAAAFGASGPFHAGIIRLAIAAQAPLEAPLEVLVWYPTEAAERPWQAGPFTLPATRDAAFAPGRFPIVLLSHGGGRGGGTPLLLGDLAANLARRGSIVIAPFHGKTGLRGRPLQVKQALEAVLADPRVASHADAARLGMVGFSLGTAVTLELAGAIPNAAHLVAYCTAHPAVQPIRTT